MQNVPFQVRAASRNIHLVDLTCTSRTDEWWFLLSGDRHHDNPHADHELEKLHLDQAVERRAGIIDVGDLHCAMEGKFDPRRNKSGIREEHALAADYLDSLVRHAALWDLDEEAVSETANAISAALWRVGYRRSP